MTENTGRTSLMDNIQSWAALDAAGLTPHVIFQRADQTLQFSQAVLTELSQEGVDTDNAHLHYEWSVELRDFLVLLRDSLLSSVKYDAMKEDDEGLQMNFNDQLKAVLSKASAEVFSSYSKSAEQALKSFKHQMTPVDEILAQVGTLKAQCKKIYRSLDKISEMRLLIDSYKRDFLVGFHKQTAGVETLIEKVTHLKMLADEMSGEVQRSAIGEMINYINDSYGSIEALQSLESMEMISYSNTDVLSIPVDVEYGGLTVKTLSPQAEIAKWYSSNIYPHIIELERKRNLAVEQTLSVVNQVRIQLSALLLEEDLHFDIGNLGIRSDLKSLMAQHIEPLKDELEENATLVNDRMDNDLLSSKIYDKGVLFIPHGDESAINNWGRDAQKRVNAAYTQYRRSTFEWLRDSLAKYIELDRIPFNTYISNKLSLDLNDDRLSIFLKDGYLGNSFTVERPDLIEPILSDYRLWNQGFAGSVLVTGPTGVGKSTLLGVLSQSQLNNPMVIVRAGDPYFTKNRTFESTHDIQEVIENIALEHLGSKVILAIDNLEMWHSDERSPYDNVRALISLIQKYSGDIFFIITSGVYFMERLAMFKDIGKVFSSHIKIPPMKRSAVRTALNLRANALPELGLSDTDHQDAINDIVRVADGNPGHAMLEYCRVYNESYQQNLKSQDFAQLIRKHSTLLKYISAFKSIKMSTFEQKLNETDYRSTLDNVMYLVGNKVIVYTRGDEISINPQLVYSVEKALKQDD